MATSFIGERRGRVSGPFCPINPAHGTPYRMDSGLFHCPHNDHDGRLSSHSEGFAPVSRSFFTEAEVYGLEKENTHGNHED